MAMKRIKNTLKIIFIMASISSLFFVPWILLRILLTPLPDTVQEQVNDCNWIRIGRYHCVCRPSWEATSILCRWLEG